MSETRIGAYCESSGHEDYNLSADELLIICCAAKVNIAVFNQVERKLSFAGGSFQGEGPLICAQLLSNDRRRVRSHFERLIGVDQLEEARRRHLRFQEEQRRLQQEEEARPESKVEDESDLENEEKQSPTFT